MKKGRGGECDALIIGARATQVWRASRCTDATIHVRNGGVRGPSRELSVRHG